MIDFQEFVVMMQKKKSSMTKGEELIEAFKMFDKVRVTIMLLNERALMKQIKICENICHRYYHPISRKYSSAEKFAIFATLGS